MALKLMKYASLWWENVVKKRAKRGKPKIRNWEKMKSKLKGRLLPPFYLQHNYSKLHNLQQGNMSNKEYTRDFEKLDVGPSKDFAHVLESGPRRSHSGSKVKDMVTTLLGQLTVLSGWNDKARPDFVYLVDGIPEGLGPSSFPLPLSVFH